MEKKTEVMTLIFPNYFYSDRSNITHALTAGFHIDSIETTSQKREELYTTKKPSIPLSSKHTENPLALVYYLSKPVYQ